MDCKVECAGCKQVVCESQYAERAQETCPIKTKHRIIGEAFDEYARPDVNEFAVNASIQEFECYLQMPEGKITRNPRVEETAQFAKKMGYKKLGVAFCGGLRKEAEILLKILENRGFDVVSVCCKVGGIAKEKIGIKPEQKIAGPDNWETMCNPIAQAKILNDAGTDFNIVVGLCVGHDSLFLKYAKAPNTILVAKDRVLCHNPVAALYTTGSYYRRLMRQEK